MPDPSSTDDTFDPGPAYGMRAALRSVLSPRTWLHALRLLHYYNYTHVSQRRQAQLASGARIAPNVSFTHGERVSIGRDTSIGAGVSLWAGSDGAISIGADCLLAPGVMVTATGYDYRAGRPLVLQARVGGNVIIGDDVWVGANAVIVGPVTIGEGAIIGANAVVTKSIEPGAIAVGAPAREVSRRYPMSS